MFGVFGVFGTFGVFGVFGMFGEVACAPCWNWGVAIAMCIVAGADPWNDPIGGVVVGGGTAADDIPGI